ncbi:MAG: extracellular solute-binding protein [Clostridiales bacterium]|nr:extracellular solute-binding protein [Clostridiales bacterium]
MKTKSKIFSLLLILVMILSMIPIVSLAEAQEEPDWNSMEKYTFNWTTYFASLPAEDAIIIKKIEDRFNVDINMLPIEDSNFMEVLNTYIMGGDTPDVIRLKDPSMLITYVDQGVLGEINMDILRKYAPALCASIDNYENGSYWNHGAIDGVQYAIPAVAPGNIFHLPAVYNKTWMDKVGVTEVPTTLEEFEELLRKFTFEDPDGDGKDNTYGIASDGLRQLFGAYGINPGAPDGRTDHSFYQIIDGEIQYAAATSQYKEALKVANAWYEEGLIDPEFITGENTGGYWAISHSMVNHRIGTTVRGNYYHWTMPGAYLEYNDQGELVDNLAGSVATEFLNANPDEELVFGVPVEGPYGKGLKSWNMLSQFYLFSPEVTQDDDKFARVCAIMQWMNRQYSEDPAIKEAYHIDIYGEEGDLWYWKDKEFNEAAVTEKYKEMYPEFTAVDAYGPNQWGPTVYVTPSIRLNQYAFSLGLDQDGIVNLVQFSLPKMSEYQTNLTNLKDQWMISFITGKKDVDADWDAYIAEMNASGLEKMTENVREWYASTQVEVN